jgi:hypothetical protein
MKKINYRMSIGVKRSASSESAMFERRDSLKDLDDLYEILVEEFWEIERTHGKMKTFREYFFQDDNPNKKYLEVLFGYWDEPEPRSMPIIKFELRKRPHPQLKVSLTQLRNYSNQPVFFPFNEDYIRFAPRKCFRKWFDIITRDQPGGIEEFNQYIEEQKQIVMAMASRKAMGSS